MVWPEHYKVRYATLIWISTSTSEVKYCVITHLAHLLSNVCFIAIKTVIPTSLWHLSHSGTFLSTVFILLTGTSGALCVKWSCEGLGCAINDLTHTCHTHISRSLISRKHTHILNCKSLEHIVNPSHAWQTQHLSDPEPHLSYVSVSVFVICVCLWCLCVTRVWYVCMPVLCARDRERMCLIKCPSEIIYQKMRHSSPIEITHWKRDMTKCNGVNILYEIHCLVPVCVCERERARRRESIWFVSET